MHVYAKIYHSFFSQIHLEKWMRKHHPLQTIREFEPLISLIGRRQHVGKGCCFSIVSTRVLFIVSAFMSLVGCSLSDNITQGSIDYGQSLDAVTNNMLVTNILLARDQAPLEFTDLSQIRGALQLQAQGQVSGPFGPNLVSTSRVRDMFQSGITVNSNPTFDVVPLNTKEFTTGITTPIDIKFLQYYLNRGWPANYIYNIFIEKIDIVTNYPKDQLICEFINRPGRQFKPDTSDLRTCNERARQVFAVTPANGTNVTFWQDLLPILTRDLEFTSYKKRAPYGPEINLNAANELLKSADKLSQSGLELVKLPSGRYQLFKQSDETALCLEPTKSRSEWHRFEIATLGKSVSRVASDKANDVEICKRSAKGGELAESETPGAKAPQIFLYLRSVEAMVTFLGQMLLVDREYRVLPFHISQQYDDDSRFGIRYRGQEYYVNETAKTCRYLKSIGSEQYWRMADKEGNCPLYENEDQTLFILGILNQTLNLYKNANEIPTTKAVQSVP
jgi:hypothetical protein